MIGKSVANSGGPIPRRRVPSLSQRRQRTILNAGGLPYTLRFRIDYSETKNALLWYTNAVYSFLVTGIIPRRIEVENEVEELNLVAWNKRLADVGFHLLLTRRMKDDSHWNAASNEQAVEDIPIVLFRLSEVALVETLGVPRKWYLVTIFVFQEDACLQSSADVVLDNIAMIYDVEQLVDLIEKYQHQWDSPYVFNAPPSWKKDAPSE